MDVKHKAPSPSLSWHQAEDEWRLGWNMTLVLPKTASRFGTDGPGLTNSLFHQECCQGKEKNPKPKVIPEHSLKAAAFPESHGVITTTVN